uniref:Uncharacterized protein n=1 Tax=Sphaeramia orbicularis TaxID=375764 RepID=A0A672ZBI9_9TELE
MSDVPICDPQLRESLVQSQRSLQAQPRPLMLPVGLLELSGTEGIMGDPALASCQVAVFSASNILFPFFFFFFLYLSFSFFNLSIIYPFVFFFSLLSSFSQLSQTFISRVDWLEQEVSAHRSHVTALRSELQDACLRDNLIHRSADVLIGTLVSMFFRCLNFLKRLRSLTSKLPSPFCSAIP